MFLINYRAPRRLNRRGRVFVPEAQENFKIEGPWNSILYILGKCFILFSQIIVSYSTKTAILVPCFLSKNIGCQKVHLTFFVKLLSNFTLQLWNVVKIIQIMTCFLHNNRFCRSENNCFVYFFNQQAIEQCT